MTAQRQDGTTAGPTKRPRASGALKASMIAPVRPAPAPEPAAPVVPVPSVPDEAPPVGQEKLRTTKYTALLDDEAAVAFDGLALAARRKLRRRVDKSEIMRALLLLAADDASLRDQVIGQLPAESPRKAGKGGHGRA